MRLFVFFCVLFTVQIPAIGQSDSVAEAYAVNGERERAIKNYKRSLELDPKNLNAVQQLKRLDPRYK